MWELNDMNLQPMNTVLERHSKDTATVKRTERKGKTVKDAFPTKLVISIKYKMYRSTPIRDSHIVSETFMLVLLLFQTIIYLLRFKIIEPSALF